MLFRLTLVGVILWVAGCGGNDVSPGVSTAPPPGESLDEQEMMQRMMQHAQAGENQEILALLENFMANNPNNDRMLHAGAQVCLQLSQEAHDRGDREEATDFALRAGAYLRKWIEADPELARKQAELCASIFYIEAIGHTFREDNDRAIEALTSCFDIGFANFDMLDNDPSFDELRRDPKFEAFIDEYRAVATSRNQQWVRTELTKTQPFEFDFSLETPEGTRVTLSELKGKVVLVDLWGTWCAPCRQQIPALIHLYETYREQGVEVIGINYEDASGETLDAAEIDNRILTAVDQMNISYPCLIGDMETAKQVPGFNAFPTMVIVDKRGVARHKMVGLHPYDQLQAMVELLLSEPATEAELGSTDAETGANENEPAPANSSPDTEEDTEKELADPGTDASTDSSKPAAEPEVNPQEGPEIGSPNSTS